ncbi:MAG: hypothetical protein GF346_07690 [Candidatus Eisenbacteria bacterium]|nr:hypothetical protein [Candidatus Latescibacterota bacterium]MBD3302314.1 hypothetical protein [Candidatus Eisenbacteria bacterium]
MHPFPGMMTRTSEIVAGLAVLLVLLAGCAGGRQTAAFERWQATEEREPERPAIAPADTVRTLDQVVATALRKNRSVEAARQDWRAALEEAPQAGALPDPVLSFGYFIEEVETRVGPQKQRLGVKQSVPWFGTLGARKEAALAGAEAARYQYLQAAADLVRDAKRAYADLYELSASIEVTRANHALLRYWERVLSTRYSTGEAGYSDLIQVQVELARLEDRLRSLEERRDPLVAALNALMDRPAAAPVGVPTVLPDEEPSPDATAVRKALRDRNPDLRAHRAMVEREEAGADLAGKSGYPDFTVGVDWIRTDPRKIDGLADDGKDPILAHVGVRLPLWRGRVSAAKEEAEARREAAAARLEDRTRSLAAHLETLLYRYEDADRRIGLYRDAMIPKGEQALEAASSAYEAGEADFLRVLDAERTLLEFELSLARARADRLRTRAGIDALLGGGAIKSRGE